MAILQYKLNCIMKTYMSCLVATITFLLVTSCSLTNDIENQDNSVLEKRYTIDRAWSYDTVASPEQWKQYHSLDEKFEACQIPATVLSEMTTNALVKTCVAHPLANIYSAYGNRLNGIGVFADRFNAFQELLTRSDAAEAFVEVYSNVKVTADYCNPYTMDNTFMLSSLSIGFLELLMGSGLFPDIISPINRQKLREIAEKRINDLQESHQEYSYLSIEGALFLLALCELQDDEIDTDKAQSILSELRSKYEAMSSTKAYLGTTTLYTPFGQSVQGRLYSEVSDNEKAALLYYYTTYFPNANVVDQPSGTYNGNSYAWNMSEGGVACWLYPYTISGGSNIEKYWTQDYYDSCSSSIASRVVYDDMDHSALYYPATGTCISKWDNGPLMEHSLADCPFPSNDVHYYGQIPHWSAMTIPTNIIVGVPSQFSIGWPATRSDVTCIWEIYDHNEQEAGFSHIPNGRFDTITFTKADAFEIYCYVYWNETNELIGWGSGQVIVS